MKYKLDTSRMGMLIFLGVVLAALWLVAAYGFYKESERAKYDVSVSPGAVTYGTHSTALMPMTISPLKHVLPMISGGEIRSYARHGHATMSNSGGSGNIHTTSSAKVKSIGSGGSGSSGMMTSSGNSRSSQRGIIYSGASASVPVLAMTTSSQSASLTKAPHAIGLRKAKWAAPTGEGEEGDTEEDDEILGKWWWWDGEKWAEAIAGVTTRNVYDPITDSWKSQIYNGSGWDDVPDQTDPGLPVGPMPWLLMVLLAAGYAGYRRRKEIA